ncbi:MAG: PilZ domain-containing protein [Deltaproteobacteria bacterium]|nr:PilZ domain-containing protein [Deltaproteobacteria bacterium]
MHAHAQLEHDRRREPRAPISVAVRQRLGPTNPETHLCQAGDINTQGMFLAKVYDEHDPAPSRCWLEFTLPGSPVEVRAKADVVWQARHQHYQLMAVRFAVLAPSHRRLIERYTEGDPIAPRLPPFAPPP